MNAKTQVSVIIPAHNEGKFLRATVDAVLKSTTVPLEVVVVNDESTDGSCDFLTSEDYTYAPIRLIQQKRSGSSLSRNCGAHNATGAVLVFLDAHCSPGPGWLEGLLDVLAKRRDALLTPCISALQDRSLKGYGVTTDSTFSYTWLGERKQATTYEIPIACGACMILRKELFFSVGGFDNTSIWGMEDIEFSIRYWLCGHTVLVVPQVEVAHLFKEAANFHVGWKNWVYNALRCALLHFDGSRLSRILAALELKPEASDAVEMLWHSDIWERLDFTLARRRRESDWFCERFSLAI